MLTLVLLLLLQSASAVERDGSAAQRQLDALVDEYVDGDADRAVRTLAAWSARQLRESEAPPGVGRDGWKAAARVLLHYEASRQPRTEVALHRELADRYLGDIDKHMAIADGAFRAMYRDLHLLLRVRGDAWGSLRDKFPDDPTVVLAHGRFLEYWSPRVKATRSTEFGFMIGEPVLSSDQGQFGPEIHQAEAAFRSVLKLAPAMVEARVRLGRVLWMQDRRREAIQELTQAATEAVPHSPEWAYLAHVFLGRIYEEGNRANAAADEYRTAVRLLPNAHVAALRLGRILVESPSPSEGWRLASAPLRVNPPSLDPWLLYFSERTAGIEGAARARAVRSRLRSDRPR